MRCTPSALLALALLATPAVAQSRGTSAEPSADPSPPTGAGPFVDQEGWRPGPGSDDLTFDLAFLGATAAWSRGISDGVSLGLALGGGLPMGFTVWQGDITSGRDGGSFSPVGEIIHAAAFLRRRTANGRAEVEIGPRVARAYHPDTEYESIFAGLSLGVLVRAGPLFLGPRFTLGRYGEQAGRSEVNLAVIPLVARLRWVVDPGRRP